MTVGILKNATVSGSLETKVIINNETSFKVLRQLESQWAIVESFIRAHNDNESLTQFFDGLHDEPQIDLYNVGFIKHIMRLQQERYPELDNPHTIFLDAVRLFGLAALSDKIKAHDSTAARRILDLGVNLNNVNVKWREIHPLCVAAIENQQGIFDLLLPHSSNQDLFQLSGHILMFVEMNKHQPDNLALTRLLNYGIDPNSNPDQMVIPPLICAVLTNQAYMFNLLLSRGAKVQSIHQAKTALMFAAFQGQAACRLFL